MGLRRHSRLRPDAIPALLAVISTLALGAGACSDSPVSFIVLTLQSATPTAITGVDTIRVSVSKGQTQMRVLEYDGKGATINQVTASTLSVGFSSGESGLIDFGVDLLNDDGCTIGHGEMSKDIAVGGIAQLTVALAAIVCVPDGGAPDGGPPEGGVLPGCDPVTPASAATGTMCTATQTCQVDCMPPSGAQPRNECTAGGSGAPGTTCTTNADCQPGTQCFNYAVTGCQTKVCLRFCNTTQDCAAFGAGGGGPGSFCEGPVMCPTFLTAYHTCTFNCDPRAAAAATRGGCPGALACTMTGAMDQVDCTCVQGTRKQENEVCTASSDCAPGLLCNLMAGTRVCRPICRCNANAAGACTNATNDCPTSGTVCQPLTNNTIYGICL
jgi:hypothetical protein